MNRSYLFLLAVSIISHLSNAQNLLLKNSRLESFLRRGQLVNSADPTNSMMILPSVQVADSLDQNFVLQPYRNHSEGSVPLPIELNGSFSKHHPLPWNNGSMVPSSRQSMISFGAYQKHKFFSYQFRPEILSVHRPKYNGFPESNGDLLWAHRYIWWNTADNPEQFGDKPYHKIYAGQSNVKLSKGKVTFGVSTENLWWGPGKYNSMIMSNNAPGFLHGTIHSNEPIQSAIGSIEFEVIGGRLYSSGRIPPEYSRDTVNAAYYISPNRDWRYLSGLVLTLQPKLIKGLFLGYANTLQQYGSNLESGQVLGGLTSVFVYPNKARNIENRQQLSSVFVRWVFPEDHAEVYFEYGYQNPVLTKARRSNTPYTIDGYTIGMSKLFLKGKNRAVEFELEITQLQQPPQEVIETGLGFYTDSKIRQGYTHRGEYLGASIGPGSNIQTGKLGLINGVNQFSFIFQRLAHNKDFYYYNFRNNPDFRRYWVDYSFGFISSITFGSFFLNTELRHTWSLNYQWEHPADPNKSYLSRGNDVKCVQAYVNLIYFIPSN